MQPDSGVRHALGDVAVVVLAAGAGTRMGTAQGKLAQPVNGMALLAWTLQFVSTALAGIAHHCRVVLRPDSPLTALVEHAGGQPVIAHDAHRGMAWSLHTGLHAGPDVERGAFVVLGDDPLAALSLRDVVRAAAVHPKQCVSVDRAGDAPHPVYLPRAAWPLRPAGSDASGDTGLRHMLEGGIRVRSASPAPIDVDTPDDLRRLASELAQMAR